MKFDPRQSLAGLRSKLTKTRLLGLGAVALAALTLSSCGANGFAVEGVVVDSDSGKPVPNAWVHQEWKVSDRIPMSWSSSSATGCVAEQVSKADANGKFRFEVPTTLHYNAITQSAVAVMSPLILGYSLDEARVEERGTKSSLIMTSRVIVAVKRDEAPLTRQAFVLRMTGAVAGGGRCQGRTDEVRTLLNQQLSAEAVKQLRDSNVSLEELGNAIKESAKSRGWPIYSDREMESYLSYRTYREQLNRAEAKQ